MDSSQQSTALPINEIPKTLVLTPDLILLGGVSNYYKTLGLDENTNITYFTVNTAKPQSVIETAFRLLANYCKFIFKLIINRYKIIVVNPSLDMGRSFHRDLIFIIITHILKRKTIVFFRGWLEAYEEKIIKSKFKSFLFRISYAKVDKYIVLGNIFKNKLIRLGVPSKTEFFIETTVADSSFLKEFDITRKYDTFNEKIILLFLGSIRKEKGIYIAIDAFVKFLKTYPERKSSLIIAGDGPDLPAVKRYVEEHKIPNINFMGNVSSKRKKKVLLESHVMIFPSFTEGLPNVILEGMLYGMPIISRVTGGIPEVVHQKRNGYLSESFNPSVFADFLSILALDEELYKKIAKENHSTALKKYTVEKVRERIFNIIGKIEV